MQTVFYSVVKLIKLYARCSEVREYLPIQNQQFILNSIRENKLLLSVQTYRRSDGKGIMNYGVSLFLNIKKKFIAEMAEMPFSKGFN